ncbi:hypothetical protein [Pseudaestuariivita rosea]|uniref:hypothetical protein n=1 Tax=Pseudaestuariivita rosea TaxID=2763263 RepID=UPI001ABA95FE|nr:hypothetical protein [Pseudaestuariivita rosea]
MPKTWKLDLQDDEEVLWRGHPGYNFDQRKLFKFTSVFGLGIIAVTIYALLVDERFSTTDGLFAGLFFISIGLLFVFGPAVIDFKQRRKTSYLLTNRRAFIGFINLFGDPILKVYHINQDTELKLVGRKELSVYFAVDTHKGRHSGLGYNVTFPVGFEFIKDARKVFNLMQAIQRTNCD